MKPAISIKNLSYSYLGSVDKVLNNISLEVPQGSFFVFTGASGGGKSTLLMLLRGFSHEIGGSVSGEIFVSGYDVFKTPISKLGSTIGIVFQNPGLQLHQLKVFDEIMSAGIYRGVPLEECRKKTRRLLNDIVGEKIGEMSPEDLSGGQKQKVALAASLMFDAPIMLLDEPFSFLDVKAKKELLDILIGLNRQGKTIVIATHDIGLVAKTATGMAIIDRGGILLAGNPQEVIYSHQMAQTAGMPLFAQIVHDAGSKESPLSWNELFDIKNLIKNNSIFQRKNAAHKNKLVELSLENVGYYYSKSGFGIKNITCDFYRGEIFGIIGANGSGKSTLAKVIAGLLKSKSGRIIFNGKNFTALPDDERARHIGYATQDPLDMFFEMTVSSEVSAGPKFLHYDIIKERVEKILKEFFLWQYKSRHPDSISGGEKKRLGIADIVINDCDVILIDEPEFGLDRNNWKIICDYLRGLAGRGKTIIIITQDLEAAYLLCDRMGVVCGGELVASAAPDIIFRDRALLDRSGLLVPEIANWQITFKNDINP